MIFFENGKYLSCSYHSKVCLHLTDQRFSLQICFFQEKLPTLSRHCLLNLPITGILLYFVSAQHLQVCRFSGTSDLSSNWLSTTKYGFNYLFFNIKSIAKKAYHKMKPYIELKLMYADSCPLVTLLVLIYWYSVGESSE